MVTKEEYEQIEAYLNGTLKTEQRAQFEQRLRNEPQLAKETAEQRLLLQSFRVYGKRNQFKEQLEGIHQEMQAETARSKRLAFESYGVRAFWKKHLPTMAVAASVALVTVFSTLLVMDYVRSLENKQATYYRALKREVDNIKRKQNVTNDLPASNAPVVVPARYSATGFVVSSNGYLVTDYHVIEGANSLFIESRAESRSDKIQRYQVKEVYSDPARDLAILKIVDTSFVSFGQLPYTFKTTESELGEPVYTLAYPREDIVYGDGSISSLTGFEGDTTAYQISIPVNPGNSGGPLLDGKGHLIGIVKGKSVAEDGAAFAVKSKHLLKLIRSIPKDSLSGTLALPRTNRMKGLKRPEQIKQIQGLVFNVKVYH
ncbi:MAG: trypsin-like peptidase domain-containing protein [Ferruginibacter sp.]|nr:trypsin-like peptidase domain-containing protein [Cytophagales bacterium]